MLEEIFIPLVILLLASKGVFFALESLARQIFASAVCLGIDHLKNTVSESDDPLCL